MVRARVYARHDPRTCRNENVKRKMVPFIFITPMHSYVTNVFVYNLHITVFSRVY